jgi:hypothetical protein
MRTGTTCETQKIILSHEQVKRLPYFAFPKIWNDMSPMKYTPQSCYIPVRIRKIPETIVFYTVGSELQITLKE